MTQPNTPWYRHSWPWILMAGPAIVVVAGLTTAWLALDTADGLVEDDYYKQGLAVARRVERDNAAAVRGLSADIELLGQGEDIRVALAGSLDVPPASLRLRLLHPTRTGLDTEVHLILDAGRSYRGVAKSPIVGRWNVVLEDPQGDWRLVGECNLARGRPISIHAELPPAPKS